MKKKKKKKDNKKKAPTLSKYIIDIFNEKTIDES